MGTSDYDYGKSVASNGGNSYGLNGDAYSGYLAEQQRRESAERMQADILRQQQEQAAEALRKQNGGW